MSIQVSRPINGISLNGNEYLLLDDGRRMEFSSVESAKDFLLAEGCEEEELEWFNFEPLRGQLWWIADDHRELSGWLFDLPREGVKVVRLDARDYPRIGIIFELEKSKAKELLGYEPEPEEWLEWLNFESRNETREKPTSG